MEFNFSTSLAFMFILASSAMFITRSECEIQDSKVACNFVYLKAMDCASFDICIV